MGEFRGRQPQQTAEPNLGPEVTNHRREPVRVEVVRTLLGSVDESNHEGKITLPGAWTADDIGQPVWWHWYSWPSWWYQLNARGRVQWDVTLPPGEKLALRYQWHYFWRW